MNGGQQLLIDTTPEIKKLARNFDPKLIALSLILWSLANLFFSKQEVVIAWLNLGTKIFEGEQFTFGGEQLFRNFLT